jgi:Dolichyl-phosphate-mannose-protein mannosyltransferase
MSTHSWYEYPAPRSAVSTDLSAPSPPPPSERDPTGAARRERDLSTTPRERDLIGGTPRERDLIAAPRERGFALALLGVAVALRLLGVWEYRFNSDEPQHAHVVWGWTRGLIQYRDFFDNHTPLFHMLWAPLLAAFGESVRTLFRLRLTMLPLYLAALAVTWLIGRRLLSPRAALWGTVLTALLPPFFVKTLEFRTDVPWTLLWLVAFQVATGGAPGPARLFVAGLAVGAAAAVSLKSSLLLACLLGSALAAAAWRLAGGNDTSLRPTPRAAGRALAAAGAGLAGLAAVPAGVALYFQRHGALDGLLAGAVRHNLQVSQHGPAPLKRALILAVGAPLLIVVARWSLSAGPPALARQRLLLALTAGSYLIALEVLWPLITSQTYLPVEPLLCLFVAAAAVGGSRARQPGEASRPRIAWGSAFLALALAVELVIDLLHGPLRGDQTAPTTAIVAAALRLTAPDEAVFDDKGDAVFRRRAFVPVLEDITREAMAEGRIADTIPEAILAHHVCVATLASRRLPPRGKRFLDANFLPVGPVRVCGRWLPGAAGQPPYPTVAFQVEIPGRYTILGSGGPARGGLDGIELTAPRDLAAGVHVFAPRSPPPWALLWARAAERGFSPFPPTPAGPRR